MKVIYKLALACSAITLCLFYANTQAGDVSVPVLKDTNFVKGFTLTRKSGYGPLPVPFDENGNSPNPDKCGADKTKCYQQEIYWDRSPDAEDPVWSIATWGWQGSLTDSFGKSVTGLGDPVGSISAPYECANADPVSGTGCYLRAFVKDPTGTQIVRAKQNSYGIPLDGTSPGKPPVDVVDYTNETVAGFNCTHKQRCQAAYAVGPGGDTKADDVFDPDNLDWNDAWADYLVGGVDPNTGLELTNVPGDELEYGSLIAPGNGSLSLSHNNFNELFFRDVYQAPEVYGYYPLEPDGDAPGIGLQNSSAAAMPYRKGNPATTDDIFGDDGVVHTWDDIASKDIRYIAEAGWPHYYVTQSANFFPLADVTELPFSVKIDLDYTRYMPCDGRMVFEGNVAQAPAYLDGCNRPITVTGTAMGFDLRDPITGDYTFFSLWVYSHGSSYTGYDQCYYRNYLDNGNVSGVLDELDTIPQDNPATVGVIENQRRPLYELSQLTGTDDGQPRYLACDSIIGHSAFVVPSYKLNKALRSELPHIGEIDAIPVGDPSGTPLIGGNSTGLDINNPQHCEAPAVGDPDYADPPTHNICDEGFDPAHQSSNSYVYLKNQAYLEHRWGGPGDSYHVRRFPLANNYSEHSTNPNPALGTGDDPLGLNRVVHFSNTVEYEADLLPYLKAAILASRNGAVVKWIEDGCNETPIPEGCVEPDDVSSGDVSTYEINSFALNSLEANNSDVLKIKYSDLSMSAIFPDDDGDGDGMPDHWESHYGLDPLINDASGDMDGDSLLNDAEYIWQTFPDDVDTDGDGLSDFYEVGSTFTGNPYSPVDQDGDNDGVLDGNEDFDSDAMPNAWELKYGLNPVVNDNAGDLDGDSLLNGAEYSWQTLPNDVDTDNDGLSDFYEVGSTFTGNPYSAIEMDTDGDGLSDGDEDFDHDSLPNAWEFQHSRDPLSADYQLSVGARHSCMLDDTGVHCWGRNVEGQAPDPVTGLTSPEQVSAGETHSCAIDDGGTEARCWGNNGFGQAPASRSGFTHLKQISVSGQHSCGLDDSGVSCWGLNHLGQAPATGLDVLVNPKQISVGEFFSCALDDEGVKCWGLGYTDIELITTLVNPSMVSAGKDHACAMDEGEIQCWGDDTYGQGTISPAPVHPLSVAAGAFHTCVIDDTDDDDMGDAVKCWGAGKTEGTEPHFGQSVDHDSLDNAVQLLTGWYNTCVLSNAGIECWGFSGWGQNDISSIVIDPDGDGLLAAAEAALGTSNLLVDTDDDGVDDPVDVFPTDPDETTDTDSDGVGDNSDNNIDGDCYENDVDPTPLLAGTMQSGDLDCTFNDSGVVTTDIASEMDKVMSVITQADGKLVVAGYTYSGASAGYDFALARYNTDGSLDTGFGSGGKVITDTGDAVDNYATAVIQGMDGGDNEDKLIVVGYSLGSNGYHFTIAKYNANGSFDSAFHSGGIHSFQLIANKSAYAYEVLEQPDGKIVIGGYTDSNSAGNDFAIVRMLSDGTMDTSFGGGWNGSGSDRSWNNVGTRTTMISSVGTKHDEAYSMIRQTDGKLVLAGSSCQAASGSTCTDIDVALVRYNTDGTLDTSFDSDGKLTTAISTSSSGTKDDVVLAILQQADGKLLVGGYSNNANDGNTADDLLVARYNLNGSLDNSTSYPATGNVPFNTTGVITADSGAGGTDRIHGLVQQVDGKLVLVGSIFNGTNDDIIWARLALDGTVSSVSDLKFSAIGSANDAAWSVALQADGKHVVAGYTNNGTSDDFAVLRYFSQSTDVDSDDVDDFNDACPEDDMCQ